MTYASIPRAVGFLVAALVCVSAGSEAQPHDPKREQQRQDQREHDLRRYNDAVEAYLASDDGASISVLMDPAWDQHRLTALFREVDGLRDPKRRWPATRYAAAALLHLDVAHRLAPSLNSAHAMLHLTFASNMLRQGLRERGPELRPLAARIYVAWARLLRDNNEVVQAEDLLATARSLVPGDAAILFESGRLAELLATDYALAGAAVQVSASAAGRTVNLDAVKAHREGHLNDALRWFREAGALTPDDELTQVHVGRVLALKRQDDARAVLTRVAQSTRDDAIAYLAWLFLGGLLARDGELEDAATSYRAALKRFPRGHAAYMGLADVLVRRGQGAEARELINTMLGGMDRQVREPMWWYLFDPPGVAASSMASVRAAVRQ
jgi:tetratricopeptide (TPR) repeat protein